VDLANRADARAGLEQEGIADELFRSMFANQTGLVLRPTLRATRLYTELRARAGRGLDLDETELARSVRVGALNQHIADLRWRELRWSKKLGLLPLLASKDGLKTFRRGIAFANRPTSGRLAIRAWVQKVIPQLAGSTGRPRGPTYEGTSTLAEKGSLLADETKRRRVVEKSRRAPAPERREFVRRLRRTLEGIQRLLAELGEDT